MTEILADPAAGLFADVHALGAAAQRVSAERDAANDRARDAEARAVLAERQAAALGQRVAELEHDCRELRKANEAWQVKFEDVTRTLELPKYPAAEAAPAAPTKRRWRR